MFFLQILPPINIPSVDNAKQLGEGFFSSPYFGVIAGIIIFLIAIFVVFSIVVGNLRKRRRMSAAFQHVILLITVPRESAAEASEKQSTTESIKRYLAPMEVFLDNLGGLRSQRGLRASLFGRADHFSFEIVRQRDGIIYFYVAVPRYLQQFLEEQLHAQYPEAQIAEVDDYNIFSSKCAILSTILKLYKNQILPIRTYDQFSIDPLNAITNSLSKIEEGDAAVIQFVVRSAKGEWHRLGAKVASKMQQNKSFKQAFAEAKPKGLFGSLFSAVPKDNKTPLEKKIYQLSPMELETIKALERKTSKAGFDTNIRVIVSATQKDKAKLYLDNIINAFSQYIGYEYSNGFKATTTDPEKEARNLIYRIFSNSNSFVLNTEELASVFHLPTPYTETPRIKWLSAKTSAAPIDISNEGIILGRNVYRGQETVIKLDREARRRHLYIIGQTGTGKSTFLQHLAKQDIKNGDGVCIIDPHGELIEDVLANIPANRANDVIYFNPADMERPLGLNLLEYDPRYPEQKTFVINEMINIFDKLYDLRQTGGPMFEQYMRNAMLLIMDHPESGSTLLEISKVLSDPEFRKYKLQNCTNQVVHDFWVKEAEKAGGEASLANMVPYITSKLTPFISNDIMRPIISQQKSSLNFREIMDQKKILLLNLSKGAIGDMNANLLGMVLVGKIWAAALSRADVPTENRHDFYLYIDEFQNFTTDTVATILSEARKYRLALNLGHQYIGQLVKNGDAHIRDAVFGNVGNQVAFRIGSEDAETMEKQFAPVFTARDLINIDNFNAYLKIIVNGQVSRPFNMEIYRHWKPWTSQWEQYFGFKKNEILISSIKEFSRLNYGQDRRIVEEEIMNRSRVKKPAPVVSDDEDESTDEEENSK